MDKVVSIESKLKARNAKSKDTKSVAPDESQLMWWDFRFVGGGRRDMYQLTSKLERIGFIFRALTCLPCDCGNEIYCLVVSKYSTDTQESIVGYDQELTMMANKFQSIEYDGCEVGLQES